MKANSVLEVADGSGGEPPPSGNIPRRLLPSAVSLALLGEPRPVEEIFTSGRPGADQQILDTAFALAWVAAAWRATENDSWATILRTWQPILENHRGFEIPGFGLQNQDLVAGHLLMAFSIIHERLAGRFDPVFLAAVSTALENQARQTYADLTDRKKYPSYAYEQNHLVIPICGLGVAAMLFETAEAHGWERFARDFLGRSFEVLAHDGWFFEGVSYWKFTLQFPLCYANALRKARGESLFHFPLFREAPRYLAHNILPDARFVFDFADWGFRVEPDGVNFQQGYESPWHTEPTYVPKGMVELLRRESSGSQWPASLDTLPEGPVPDPLDATLQLILMEENVPHPLFAEEAAASHYFPDMEVLHWRSRWGDSADAALAFKSGPPAGHHLGTLLSENPGWQLELGHAHPDAGSFLLFANGVFLANDTGYTGKKESADHNTILVDGIGQHRGGTAWRTFAAKPYSEYDKIRMEHVWHSPVVAASTAVFGAAYDDALGLLDVRRSLVFVAGRFLLVFDTIRSTMEHEYEWRLHGDQPATESRTTPARFLIENGPGRLIMQALTPGSCGGIISHRVAPTIVETECFSETRSRPQQRGFHLALVSPRTRDFEFVVAMGVQPTQADSSRFNARVEADGRFEFSDHQGECTIWLGANGCRDFDGIYAYHLRDTDGETLSAGMLGRTLTVPGLTLRSNHGEVDSVSLT